MGQHSVLVRMINALHRSKLVNYYAAGAILEMSAETPDLLN